jgi:hypothetical protein
MRANMYNEWSKEQPMLDDLSIKPIMAMMAMMLRHSV